MKDWKECAESLMNFAHNMGVPTELISDGASMLIRKNFDFAKKVDS